MHRFSWVNEWKERADANGRPLGIELIIQRKSAEAVFRRSGLVHRGTQEIPVAVLGHPFGTRQMALPGALRAFWLV